MQTEIFQYNYLMLNPHITLGFQGIVWLSRNVMAVPPPSLIEKIKIVFYYSILKISLKHCLRASTTVTKMGTSTSYFINKAWFFTSIINMPHLKVVKPDWLLINSNSTLITSDYQALSITCYTGVGPDVLPNPNCYGCYLSEE